MQHAGRLTKGGPSAEHWLCASRWDGTLHPTVHFYSALGTEPHLAEFTELWHARVERRRDRGRRKMQSQQPHRPLRGGGGWGGGADRPWNPGKASRDSSKTSRISGREVKRRTLGRLWVSKLETREGICWI